MTTPVHRFPVRVYYEDTDAAGIVYYANYLKFAERARTEMMRAGGLDHSHLREAWALVFAVRRCVVDYRRPAGLDDLLSVETRIGGRSGARLALRQDVVRDGEALVGLDIELVLLGLDLRPRRIPPALLARLAAAVDGDTS